jgi:hypothetical protein
MILNKNTQKANENDLKMSESCRSSLTYDFNSNDMEIHPEASTNFEQDNLYNNHSRSNYEINLRDVRSRASNKVKSQKTKEFDSREKCVTSNEESSVKPSFSRSNNVENTILENYIRANKNNSGNNVLYKNYSNNHNSNSDKELDEKMSEKSSHSI